MALETTKLLQAGDLYYATNYDSSRIFADVTAANIEQLRCDFETYNYTTIGHIQDFNVTHQITDQEDIIADNCNVGTIDQSAIKQANINFTWLDVNDLDVMSTILGTTTASVTAAAVAGFVQTVENGNWQSGVFIPFCNQNADATVNANVVISTGTDGALATPADYTVTQDSAGRWGITLTIGTGAVTTVDQDVTMTYDYTPYAKQLMAYKIEKQSLPLGLFKFVSCVQTGNVDTATGLTDYVQRVVYFVKFGLGADLVENYINRTRTEFAGTPVTLNGGDKGYYFQDKITFQA